MIIRTIILMFYRVATHPVPTGRPGPGRPVGPGPEPESPSSDKELLASEANRPRARRAQPLFDEDDDDFDADCESEGENAAAEPDPLDTDREIDRDRTRDPTNYTPSDRAQGRARREAAAERRTQLLKRTGNMDGRPPVQPQQKKRKTADPSKNGDKPFMEESVSMLLNVYAQSAEHSLETEEADSAVFHAQHSGKSDTGGRSVMPAETFSRSIIEREKVSAGIYAFKRPMMDILKAYKNDPTVPPEDLRAMLVAMAGCTEAESFAMVPL